MCLIWLASGPANTTHTCFEELDRHLPGGFLEQGIVDTNSPIGIGELRLFFANYSHASTTS